MRPLPEESRQKVRTREAAVRSLADFADKISFGEAKDKIPRRRPRCRGT